jgi:cytochrome c-type biogenesis protein CcmH
MIAFLIIAALAAIATAGYVVRPLWRDRGSRAAAVVTAALVALGSVAFYSASSRWEWPQIDSATTPTAMVAKLARRLEREPDDVQGWLMLGRSQTALGQYPLAIRAFQRADRLEGGRNAEAVLGIAEAMLAQTDNVMDDRSGRLFERALELSPESGRALFFSAIAAQNRNDNTLAISRFERLLASAPPAEMRSIIEAQIAALRGAPTASVSSGAAPSAAEAGAAQVVVSVAVAPALRARVTPGSTLFVFVRAPGRPGPPLAAKRLTAVLPVDVTLTPQDSMLPGVSFAAGEQVEVSAKISADGSATPKSGDLIGSITYTVGRDGARPLVIDGLTP